MMPVKEALIKPVIPAKVVFNISRFASRLAPAIVSGRIPGNSRNQLLHHRCVIIRQPVPEA